MHPSKNSDYGFTMVEILVVISIISVMVTLALPHYAAYREKSMAVSCQSNRRNIDMSEASRYMAGNKPDLTIEPKWRCPSGGTYVWLVADPVALGYPKVGCSLHFAEVPAALDDNKQGLEQIEGLIAAFSLDEGSGDSFAMGDLTAKINGAEWVEGKSGSALHFDGKDDYAQTAVEKWSGPFTVMSWVRADSLKNDQYDSVFSSGASGPNKNNFQIDSDGKGNYRFLGGTGGAKLNIGKITTDWQLVAVTFDGANVRTYNNGQLVDTGTWKGAGTFTDYAIGRNRNFNRKYAGTIDETGVFDRPVSAEEIQAYYEQTK
jgi:prepilin-type N-terminal cleavage/methylation domain-containing protein